MELNANKWGKYKPDTDMTVVCDKCGKTMQRIREYRLPHHIYTCQEWICPRCHHIITTHDWKDTYEAKR